MDKPEAMDGSGQGEVTHIPASMLPDGMEPKEGDVLQFKVLGPADAEGDVPVECVGCGGKDKEKGPEWEDEFRSAMSPASDEEPQVPEATQEGY